jgi:AraC-type transcriptional regulator N-terminus
MLTTIDLPVVSHVTRASGAEPFLGMMLTLDVRSIAARLAHIRGVAENLRSEEYSKRG